MLATAVTKVCGQVSLAKPAKVKAYYEGTLKKLEGNENAQKYFPKTLAYLNKSDNEKEFLAGGQDCIQFFKDLKEPLLADYQASGLSLQVAKEKVAQRIANLINKIQAAFQASKN